MEEMELYGDRWPGELLSDGEYVLWSGRPVKGKWFHRQDIVLIPFSLMWCGFVFFWEASVLKAGIRFMILWGLPFLVVGLYLVIGRFFAQQARKRRTRYAVTSKRVLRCQGRETDYLTYRSIPVVNKIVNRDGTGTIVFGSDRIVITFVRTTHRSRQEPAFTLEDIPEADRVYRIISEQMVNI